MFMARMKRSGDARLIGLEAAGRFQGRPGWKRGGRHVCATARVRDDGPSDQAHPAFLAMGEELQEAIRGRRFRSHIRRNKWDGFWMANRTSTAPRSRPDAEEMGGRVASSHGGLLRLIRVFATRVAKEIVAGFSRDAKVSMSRRAKENPATAQGQTGDKQATSTRLKMGWGVVTEL